MWQCVCVWIGRDLVVQLGTWQHLLSSQTLQGSLHHFPWTQGVPDPVRRCVTSARHPGPHRLPRCLYYDWNGRMVQKMQVFAYCWRFRNPAITTWDGAKSRANHGINYQPQLVLVFQVRSLWNLVNNGINYKPRLVIARFLKTINSTTSLTIAIVQSCFLNSWRHFFPNNLSYHLCGTSVFVLSLLYPRLPNTSWGSVF